MKRRVHVLDRDICSGKSDLTIVPCSGKMKEVEKPRNQERIDFYGLPRPFDLKDKFKYGEISPIFPPSRNAGKIKYFAFAASVYNDSDPEDIERIGEQIGAITKANEEIRHVEAPFLGCGDGKLHPREAMTALAKGFLMSSHPDAELQLCSDSALSVSEAKNAINKLFRTMTSKEDARHDNEHSLDAAEKVHQIFNTYISGTVQNVATGSHRFEQHASNTESNTELFKQLIEAIKTVNQPEVTASISKNVEQMQITQGTPEFKKHYQHFMSVLSDHMQVFGPVVAAYLPGLAAILK